MRVLTLLSSRRARGYFTSEIPTWKSLPQSRYGSEIWESKGWCWMHTNEKRVARPEMVGRQKTAQTPQYRHAVPARHYNVRRKLSTDFQAGLFLGITISAFIFLLVLWLWVIPTMDGAVETAMQAAGI